MAFGDLPEAVSRVDDNSMSGGSGFRSFRVEVRVEALSYHAPCRMLCPEHGYAVMNGMLLCTCSDLSHSSEPDTIKRTINDCRTLLGINGTGNNIFIVAVVQLVVRYLVRIPLYKVANLPDTRSIHDEYNASRKATTSPWISVLPPNARSAMVGISSRGTLY